MSTTSANLSASFRIQLGLAGYVAALLAVPIADAAAAGGALSDSGYKVVLVSGVVAAALWDGVAQPALFGEAGELPLSCVQVRSGWVACAALLPLTCVHACQRPPLAVCMRMHFGCRVLAKDCGISRNIVHAAVPLCAHCTQTMQACVTYAACQATPCRLRPLAQQRLASLLRCCASSPRRQGVQHFSHSALPPMRTLQLRWWRAQPLQFCTRTTYATCTCTSSASAKRTRLTLRCALVQCNGTCLHWRLQ